jgi:hypothetical protein
LHLTFLSHYAQIASPSPRYSLFIFECFPQKPEENYDDRFNFMQELRWGCNKIVCETKKKLVRASDESFLVFFMLYLTERLPALAQLYTCPTQSESCKNARSFIFPRKILCISYISIEMLMYSQQSSKEWNIPRDIDSEGKRPRLSPSRFLDWKHPQWWPIALSLAQKRPDTARFSIHLEHSQLVHIANAHIWRMCLSEDWMLGNKL